MIKNYLTVSIRNLLKNKFYLFINVTGLGLALATCIVAYLNTQYGYNFDSQHVNADKIYKVHINKASDHGMTEYGMNPMPLGPMAKNDIGDIKMQVRYTNPDYIIQKGDLVFNKEIGFADVDFLDMFTYPLKYGDKSAFRDKKNIFLSEEMSNVYFGDENPVGELLTLRNRSDEEFSFLVAGVFEKIPLNSSIYFDALVNFDSFYDIRSAEKNDWRRFVAATYFYIDTPEQASTVEGLLQNYVSIQNDARDDWKVAEYHMLTLFEFGSSSNDLLANWVEDGMDPAQMWAPPIMALLILLIACFNFTNTSIAISSQRLKEIGIRKVMGGGKRQLILQFMAENLMVSFIAIILAVAIANYLVPAYSAMWPEMNLVMDFVKDPQIYIFLFGMLLGTAILAGLYPSVYVSSFEPVKILRGTLKFGGTSKFSRVLLSAQYMFTIMALFAGVAFIQNAKYQETLDLGYNRDTVIGAQIENRTDYLKLREAMASNPDIEMLVGTDNHIGRWDYSNTLRSENREIESFMLDFGVNYIEAMDIEIIEGRSFSADLKQSDIQGSLLVNQRLAREFGWSDPIGQRVAVDDSTTLTVIGVVKDFYFNGFWKEVDLYGMRLVDEENYNFLVAKVPGDKVVATYEFMEDKWREAIPNKPFGGFYQEEVRVIKEAKEVNANIIIIFGFLSIISVVLSGIGLFTLVSLNIIRRIKEIGVRKVLGAPVLHIIQLMNKPFAMMIIIGGTAGLALGYFMVDGLIAAIFKNHKALDVITFAIPLATIIIISMMTSTLRILGAARRNPVESLRYE